LLWSWLFRRLRLGLWLPAPLSSSLLGHHDFTP
jgi:hypothetical protein